MHYTKNRVASEVRKDFATSDMIRNKLQNLNITIKDTKEGAEWSID